MFDSLDEQLKVDAHKSMSATERTLRWVLGLVIALLVLGAMYWGMHVMQG